MKSFEVQIGPEQRILTIEPVQNKDGQEGAGRQFKIFGDTNSQWLENEQAEDVPAGNYLGTITVHSDKDFTFDGAGDFSGDELLGIAAQITRHPSFKNL